MDQSIISNRSSAIKDNDNIHSSISDQSYISTWETNTRKTERRAVSLKGHMFRLMFPKIEKYIFLKREILYWSGSSFGQRTWYDTYVILTHVIIEFKI